MMQCPSCSSDIPEGVNFCPQCGSALASTHDAESTAVFAAVEDADEEAQLKELAAGQACLIVRKGPAAGTKFVMDRDVVALGRHPQSDIFLNDITVSRRHAEVRREGHAYTVADLGSLNGTYVNRERVDSSRLHSGDELQVGKFRLTFLVAPEK